MYISLLTPPPPDTHTHTVYPFSLSASPASLRAEPVARPGGGGGSETVSCPLFPPPPTHCLSQAHIHLCYACWLELPSIPPSPTDYTHLLCVLTYCDHLLSLKQSCVCQISAYSPRLPHRRTCTQYLSLSLSLSLSRERARACARARA